MPCLKAIIIITIRIIPDKNHLYKNGVTYSQIQCKTYTVSRIWNFKELLKSIFWSTCLTLSLSECIVLYVQVELDTEKQLKLKVDFFLDGVNISVNQMISAGSKGVNNTHM